ncbi:DUF1329 domain-containing protein [Endozoicomonas arenosclerae]|uniref:DUF1329 domain-containing protein n=1 Tax=Endozoicomonas arenosclerae TaxID=1633495 RepID=UPI00078250F7|nr:DUF1329 domain-containing protein [Endozoicomonas arenosclerae]
MIIKKSLLAGSIVGALITATGLSAKVPPEEAAKLGKELTPVGATRAGNAEGTIPAWNPDFKPPASYKGSGSEYPDPYADEKPLFTITAANVQEHKDKLSPGQVKLFETYPETFKMHVYPSHRDGGYSDFVQKNTMLNATRATLADGGNGVRNAFGGAPFPIPANGEQVAWNLNQGGSAFFDVLTTNTVVVYRNGSHLVGKRKVTSRAPYFDTKSSIEEFQASKAPRLYQIVERFLPSRDKGKSILVHEPVDQSVNPRSAWSYTPGVRRVRRAPTVAYDSPQGLGNFNPVDSSYGFNGATDKYDWKLIGKTELYIPYNSYKFENADQPMDQLLTAGHVNPDLMRYELHRVWKVEASLKEDERNVFKKRVLYVDEDSWVPSVVDLFDGRDVLWRVTMLNSINMFDLPGVKRRTSMYHDLLSREYLVDTLSNYIDSQQPLNTDVKDVAYFKPGTLRKLGVR